MLLARVRDRNIRLINATILLVGIASGMAIPLLSVHLDERGYGKEAIGTLAAWFALGIIASSVPVSGLARRLSAKTVLVGSLCVYAFTVAVFPFVTGSFAAAAAVRVIDGAATAGMWIGCETILLSRAGKDEKAALTALYAAAVGLGYMTGPLVATAVVSVASMTAAFLASGALSVLTGLLVWWRLDRERPAASVDPERPEGDGEPSAFGAILWRIKCSCFGNFAYGYFQASAVLFLPLYVIADKGLSREQAIVLPGFFALGLLLFVRVAGWYGDRNGHLSTMRMLAVMGTGAVVSFELFDPFWAMCLTVTLSGACLASISPLSLALQGVILPPQDYGRGNALYNGFYAIGMLVGPPISGRIFKAFGGATMVYHLAGLWVAFALFALLYARDDPNEARAKSRALRAKTG